MKHCQAFLLAALASVFLAYDIWLIAGGHFRPETVLGLLLWIGVLFGVCTWLRRRRHGSTHRRLPH